MKDSRIIELPSTKGEEHKQRMATVRYKSELEGESKKIKKFIYGKNDFNPHKDMSHSIMYNYNK